MNCLMRCFSNKRPVTRRCRIARLAQGAAWAVARTLSRRVTGRFALTSKCIDAPKGVGRGNGP
ncbi:hypothetical protein XFF6990_200398 [Xanthomonas citri pv. fuscans]|nr:hypothetical protein XFF6990_200398 [Xanthomonas citri pv. fuscans]